MRTKPGRRGQSCVRLQVSLPRARHRPGRPCDPPSLPQVLLRALLLAVSTLRSLGKAKGAPSARLQPRPFTSSPLPAPSCPPVALSTPTFLPSSFLVSAALERALQPQRECPTPPSPAGREWGPFSLAGGRGSPSRSLTVGCAWLRQSAPVCPGGWGRDARVLLPADPRGGVGLREGGWAWAPTG